MLCVDVIYIKCASWVLKKNLLSPSSAVMKSKGQSSDMRMNLTCSENLKSCFINLCFHQNWQLYSAGCLSSDIFSVWQSSSFLFVFCRLVSSERVHVGLQLQLMKQQKPNVPPTQTHRFHLMVAYYQNYRRIYPRPKPASVTPQSRIWDRLS